MMDRFLVWAWGLPDRWAERLTWHRILADWRTEVDAGWTTLLADNEHDKVET